MQQTLAVTITAPSRCRVLVAVACLATGCTAPPQDAEPGDALLLVSLNDGSIVGQQIDANADVCMKANGSPMTTCLTRGTPLMDTTGRTVIGYQMVETEIELIPR